MSTRPTFPRAFALVTAGALAAAGLLAVGSAAHAAPMTYTVPGDFADLASAVAAANANPGADTIEITADFTEPSTIPDIAESLTLRSSAGSRFTIDLQHVTSSGIKVALPTGSTLTVEDVAFANAPGTVLNVGGVLDASTVAVAGAAFAQNVGPAVYLQGMIAGARLEVSGSTFTDNDLGAIYAPSVDASTVTVAGTTIEGGSQYGLAVRTAGVSTVDVTDSTIAGYALGGLGASLDGNTQLSVARTALRGNGVGLIVSADNDADVAIDETVFADSTGLGLSITAPASSKSLFDVTRSTASGNAGGGIQVQLAGDGAARFVNVTSADNPGSAFSAFGAQIAAASELTIDFSTLTWMAGAGPATPTGAFRGAGVLRIANTVLAGGPGGAGAPGDVRIPAGATLTATIDYSLIGTWNTEAAAAVAGSGTNLFIDATTPIDPGLGPLTDNGGFAATRLPLAGSLLLDAGDAGYSGAPATDERGLPRLAGARVDIGASELEVAPVPSSAPLLAITGDASGAAPWGALAALLVLDGLLALLLVRRFGRRERPARG